MLPGHVRREPRRGTFRGRAYREGAPGPREVTSGTWLLGCPDATLGMALYDQSRFLARTALHRQMSVVPKLYLAYRNSQYYGRHLLQVTTSIRLAPGLHVSTCPIDLVGICFRSIFLAGSCVSRAGRWVLSREGGSPGEPPGKRAQQELCPSRTSTRPRWRHEHQTSLS